MKIGILGGGQLGKMLYAPAIKLDLDISFMDSMLEGPVSKITNHYTLGQIDNYEDVMSFGKNCDIVSIEIEKVNTRALTNLMHEGKQIFPQPDIIENIQDKGTQKQFFKKHSLPSARYKIYNDLSDLPNDMEKGLWTFPFVQKLRRDGYDGRGVKIIRTKKDLEEAFTSPFLIEELIPVGIELGVVTCRDQAGNIALYDPVEMVFHADANILLYQLAPARLEEPILKEAKDIARSVTEAYGIVGLLAIELFVTTDSKILINEVAPRPHNSGHHTIESTYCSQYENHLRAIAGYPLGATNTMIPSLLINLLGEEGFEGPVLYKGLKEVMRIPGVNVHLYGKKVTKPFRKMGHITVVGHDYDLLIEQYRYIQDNLKIISK